MIKALLIIIAVICGLGAIGCAGLLLCIILIRDSTPPAWPNYWKGEEVKKKKEGNNNE